MEKSIKKVLIVENFADMATGALRGLLYEMETISIIGHASNSTQALMLTERYKPDLIFLDINLPGKSGLYVLIEVKRRFPETKIIIVTKYADRNFRTSCKEWGSDYFFDRTCELELLDENLKYIVEAA